MRIISHRGNLIGKKFTHENSVEDLIKAVKSGYDIEFDINFDFTRKNLMLSHDIGKYDKKYEPFKLISSINTGYNALNVKNILTIPSILWMLEKYKNRKNFFMFDFELLISDIKECRFLMYALIEKGYNVAFRISERENYIDEYLKSSVVKDLWLDEFSEKWINEGIIKKMKDKGKKIFYVSPELHKDLNIEEIRPQWENVIIWGVDGICTDFPNQLNKFYGVKND